jgi:hypothetical protein
MAFLLQVQEGFSFIYFIYYYPHEAPACQGPQFTFIIVLYYVCRTRLMLGDLSLDALQAP